MIIHNLSKSLQQFSILTWKNSILVRRNLVGIFFELILSIFIISMLLVTRHFIENIKYAQQQNPTYNVIDFYYNNFDENLVLFYPPDSPLVQNIVSRAFRFIKSEKWWYNSISDYFFHYMLKICF